MSDSNYKIIKDFFDEVLNFYTSSDYYQTLIEAKKKFFEYTGKIDEDDYEFESRMIDFNEWYVLQFIPTNGTKPLIRDYFERNKTAPELAEAFGGAKHSIFEYAGESFTGKHVLRDFLYSRKIKLLKSDPLPNILKGDIFTARTIEYQGQSYLLGGVSLVPRDARSILKREAKKVGKMKDHFESERFLLKIQSLKSKWKQYGHVDVNHIFKFS